MIQGAQDGEHRPARYRSIGEESDRDHDNRERGPEHEGDREWCKCSDHDAIRERREPECSRTRVCPSGWPPRSQARSPMHHGPSALGRQHRAREKTFELNAAIRGIEQDHAGVYDRA
jgi:hypothetical protein